MFLIILRPYFTPREPSSGPPREENSKNDRAEVGEWIRIRNRYITSKDYKRLLKQLEKLEEVFLLAKRLRKLPGEGSFHCLLNRDRLRKSFKRGPWRVRWPAGRCGKASPTRLSPQAPPAPLASKPSSVPKTSIGSPGSLSSLCSSQLPVSSCPLKQSLYKSYASSLTANPGTSVKSLEALSSLSSSQPPEPLHSLECPSHKTHGRSPPRRYGILAACPGPTPPRLVLKLTPQYAQCVTPLSCVAGGCLLALE
ncbi:uncharacterized protein C5orf60-like isoform X1 [Macaca nemestrina]|uniref:uncharacterized protein C5orf60-like isoform X1 n=1 Tax=Macaca nemestrina TaxID=9545 RepID=UPI0039B8214A